MRVAEVSAAGGPFEIVKRELPEPGPGQVRVTVEACGMCHTDAVLANGWLPGTVFPAVPGHEIAGRIDALGEGVSAWRGGQRVGGGWVGGSRGTRAGGPPRHLLGRPARPGPRGAEPGR